MIRYISPEQAADTPELVVIQWRPEFHGSASGIVSIAAFRREKGETGFVEDTHEQRMSLRDAKKRAQSLAERLRIEAICVTDG